MSAIFAPFSRVIDTFLHNLHSYVYLFLCRGHVALPAWQPARTVSNTLPPYQAPPIRSHTLDKASYSGGRCRWGRWLGGQRDSPPPPPSHLLHIDMRTPDKASVLRKKGWATQLWREYCLLPTPALPASSWTRCISGGHLKGGGGAHTHTCTHMGTKAPGYHNIAHDTVVCHPRPRHLTMR